MTCPMPTNNIDSISGSFKTTFKTMPTDTAFISTGGSGARIYFFLNIYVSVAAISVDKEPTITSTIPTPPINRLLNKHPTNNPGMAAGVNTGKIVNASAIRTCIWLKLMGAAINVITIYKAAMAEASISFLVFIMWSTFQCLLCELYHETVVMKIDPLLELSMSSIMGTYYLRGYGAVGSARRSQCRGQGFDSPYLHHSFLI